MSSGGPRKFEYLFGAVYEEPTLIELFSLIPSCFLSLLGQIVGVPISQMQFEHIACIADYGKVCRLQLKDYRQCKKHQREHSTSRVFFCINLENGVINERCYLD